MSNRSVSLGAAVCACLAAGASPALAAGYDTPILYTAKHLGMGGAAIGYVDDASSLFHNPAGLSGIWKGNFLADISFLVGGLTANPNGARPGADEGSIDSETTKAPLFLLGGGFRLNDWLTAGMAIYPVASAGGSYKYKSQAGLDFEDSTTLVFFEASPGLSLEIPGTGLRIGAGYRMDLVSLERVRGEPSDPRDINLDAKGFNFSGYRIGLQWRPNENVGMGLVYRSKTTTKVSADKAAFLAYDPTTEEDPAFNLGETETEFIHPAQVGFGVRFDVLSIGIASDIQYTWGSQVKSQTFTSGYSWLIGVGEVDPADNPTSIPQLTEWEDNLTARVGLEYRLAERESGRAAVRLGYLHDGKVGNTDYPTAFGTPPAPTNSFTIGGGWDAGAWEANLAYAYRTGGADVVVSDDAETCAACGVDGRYEINLHGIYADFSYNFE